MLLLLCRCASVPLCFWHCCRRRRFACSLTLALCSPCNYGHYYYCSRLAALNLHAAAAAAAPAIPAGGRLAIGEAVPHTNGLPNMCIYPIIVERAPTAARRSGGWAPLWSTPVRGIMQPSSIGSEESLPIRFDCWIRFPRAGQECEAGKSIKYANS